ncbi:MAG: hypothetical protein J4215_01385 [Candidatus Diapherotrites archaeon]|uniref:tRNA(Phe) 7-((3-amino-3-carboxypropyl)-4-demethylwyosine(37)-N(4))-methyltransferase n=1 Tax=Candidatus Iainarchaeum sp. TaxID=3101447 RepID=A0A8T4L1K4_9ARCH|nr:hypothetical protein [Candidatus Diapherotrites archaeon]
MATNVENERFEMVKKRHFQSFHDAVTNGKADKPAIPLCEFLNSLPEFFTASSCSGRVILLNVDSMETKQTAAFHYKTHGLASAMVSWKKLSEKTRKEVWFKQESFILHIGTNHLDNANRLLECARLAGIKRGGIMLAKPGKFILELQGTQGISAPIKYQDKLLVNRDYYEFLVRRANKKMKKNSQQLEKFEKILREKLGSTD